jgi:hypothetical protein
MKRRMRLRSIPRTVSVGVCTGCSFVVVPGPWFKKRMVRHLRTIDHNHDACEMLRLSRGSVRKLLLLMKNMDLRGARELDMARAESRVLTGNS